MEARPLKTFIIYARADAPRKQELLLHLRPLVAGGLLDVWHDGDIMPGEDWEKAIKKELAASDLVLALVSVHALNSEFIQTKELRTALERLEAGLARVVPVVVSPCAWKFDPVISRLQALPQAGAEGLLPVSEWKNPDLAWAGVVEQIGDMAQELLAKRAAAEQRDAEQARQRREQNQREQEAARRREAEAEEARLRTEEARKQAERERLAREQAAAEREARRLEKARRRAEQPPLPWLRYAGYGGGGLLVVFLLWLASKGCDPAPPGSMTPTPVDTPAVPIDTQATPRQLALDSAKAADDAAGKTAPQLETQPASSKETKAPEKKTKPFVFDYAMVRVAGGAFTMGDSRFTDACPHDVTVGSFSIGRYEVTQAQWRSVMGGNNPSHFKNCDDCPVESVSWNDVQAFIKKLNQLTGEGYRLPTEEEWEFAARGGNKTGNHKYAGSDNIDGVAWHYGNSGGKTHPVGKKAANELGLYDMSGNVSEWCQDKYGPYPGCPEPIETTWSRVLRGGSWGSGASNCFPGDRVRDFPGLRLTWLYHVGFRLARH